MGNLFLSSWNFGSPLSMLRPERNYTIAAVHSPSSGIPKDSQSHLILPECATLPVKLDFHKDQPYLSKSIENMENIRLMLSQLVHKSESIVTVDALKKLCIDHYFCEEISSILDSSYHDMYTSQEENDDKIKNIALQFKLLREAGYKISSDVFLRFMDEKGEFKQSLSNDIEGLISLHEASFLNMGEEVLYKANEFSTKHLKSSMKYLGPNARAMVRHTLEHPHHMSLKQYKAKHYLTLFSLMRNKASNNMEELAKFEVQANQQLYQYEFKTITRWWKDLGLAKELTFARDQILKWYLWSMTVLPGQQFSKHRFEITKVVSFIYLIDDIFDIMGTTEELALFTQTINSWEDSSSLPRYMRICFIALHEMTCGIAQFVEKEYGWNPMNSMRRSWRALCNAFLVESKWFTNKEVPSAGDYLTNGVISSGVPLVLQITSFLLGHRVTDETVHLIEGSPLVSYPAKILRLWDDLGSAKDEDQDGFDGSYLECYMKDNPSCPIDAARAHIENLISKSWEELNKEYFSNTSFPPYFAEASINCARMVRIMYNYDEKKKLPMMNDYIQNLLSGKISSLS